MKISQEVLDTMFGVVGISQADLYAALRGMGPKAIKPAFRAGWSEQCPTWCTCYFVSEFVFFYLSPKGTTPYSVKVPSDPGLHRFLRYPNTTIIDLTADQFPDYALVQSVYPLAKITPFMQTACTGPSKRARKLAGLMGFADQWQAVPAPFSSTQLF